MWGRCYWGGALRPSGASGGGNAGGVMVMFAWLSSQERHVRAYVDLYAAHGWACLVCHSEFLTLYVNRLPTASPPLPAMSRVKVPSLGEPIRFGCVE
jgi:hypothetical protein